VTGARRTKPRYEEKGEAGHYPRAAGSPKRAGHLAVGASQEASLPRDNHRVCRFPERWGAPSQHAPVAKRSQMSGGPHSMRSSPTSDQRLATSRPSRPS